LHWVLLSVGRAVHCHANVASSGIISSQSLSPRASALSPILGVSERERAYRLFMRRSDDWQQVANDFCRAMKRGVLSLLTARARYAILPLATQAPVLHG